MAARDPARTPGGPKGTIHHAVTCLVGRWVIRGDDTETLFSEFADSDDPEWRSEYLWFVACSWMYAAVPCLFGIIVPGIAVGAFVSDDAGVAIVIFGMGAAFFCLAGAVNVYWRKAAYIPEARVHQHSPGREDAFAAAMRRTLPRNSSVVFQGAVGLVAIGIAVLNL